MLKQLQVMKSGENQGKTVVTLHNELNDITTAQTNENAQIPQIVAGTEEIEDAKLPDAEMTGSVIEKSTEVLPSGTK